MHVVDGVSKIHHSARRLRRGGQSCLLHSSVPVMQRRSSSAGQCSVALLSHPAAPQKGCFSQAVRSLLELQAAGNLFKFICYSVSMGGGEH